MHFSGSKEVLMNNFHFAMHFKGQNNCLWNVIFLLRPFPYWVYRYGLSVREALFLRGSRCFFFGW